MKLFRAENTTHPGKFTLRALAIVCVTVALAGCKPVEKTEAAAGPNVDGDTVTFPAGAPQLESIVTDTAQPRTVAIHHLTGRLYWDDDVTVHIFYSGRRPRHRGSERHRGHRDQW
jgi:hypothetical protein